MNEMEKFREFNNIFNQVSKPNKDLIANSYQNSFQQLKAINNQTNGRITQQKKVHSFNSVSQFVEGQNAQTNFMNNSITRNFFQDRGQAFQKQTPFFTPQKLINKQAVNNSDSSFQLQQLLGQQSQNIKFNEGKLIKQQQQENKYLPKRDEPVLIPSQISSVRSYGNNGLSENIYVKKSISIENQSQNNQLQSSSNRDQSKQQQQMNQNEQIFFSEREIQLPPISNTKLSQFSNSSKKQNIIPQTTCKTEPDIINNQPSQEIIKNSSQLINNMNQENLKDWIQGKDNQNQQPVLAIETKRELSNDNQTFRAQILNSPQSKLQNNQIPSFKTLNTHRRYLDRKNSKEQKNYNSQDFSDYLSSSQDNFQTVASKLLQNQFANQPSQFKQNPNVYQNQKESLTQQKQIENQISPSKNALQKILFTSTQKPSQQLSSPIDMIIQQKKNIYKQRKNKLQSWMNELNSELGGSLLGESTENQNNNESKIQIQHDSQDNEIGSQNYQQNLILQENKQSETKQIKDTKLPQFSLIENNQYLIEQSENTIKQDQKESNKPNQIPTESNISNNFENKDKRYSLNAIQQKSSSFNNQFQNQQVKETEQINKIIQHRHFSEPKLGLNFQQESQDLNQNQQKQNLLENQTPQKTDAKKYVIRVIKNDNISEDNYNFQNNSQSKQININNRNSTGKSNNKLVKSILKKRTASLKTLSNISDFGENEETKSNKKIYSSKNLFSSPPNSENSIQCSTNSQTFDISPKKALKIHKRVNFQEKVSVIDMRTKELSTTTITKQQIDAHNEEIKRKQKQEFL
ncbi:hypothetical protein TTHERM_00469120 (macronuclear) [Tetrahymena thermophila SB210]|uniref:Uncharacterized protein n=1 Tax=Tetrahymena thermophila (strain SB210) TaxID=312017 RepID=I7M442_TETTS|nr:hypothetical protein TTHERM_00469120 [Tetrahymena thermophila SB210]EAS04863.2 hypothetical protein TTHERM_00469120 [Tetrahymena thermophila SB210]|eukprot:XP_001025108.2 hypothetical protein TTHERM_00469120 [Tetrahymena thermophila SB210]